MVDTDDDLGLPSETDFAPLYPECARCFQLCGVRRLNDDGSRHEIWCAWCKTIALQVDPPRGGWEIPGLGAGTGAVYMYRLVPLTPERLRGANEAAQERKRAYDARMLELRRKQRGVASQGRRG